MSDDFGASFEPDSSQFLTIDERLEQLDKTLEDFPLILREFSQEQEDKVNLMQEKINRLYREIQLVREKKQEWMFEQHKKKDGLQKEREALLEAKKREALQDQFEKTAALIREIVADFAAWHMAREYQAEDIIAAVHQYVIGEPGIMNANEMALGKTFESIVTLYILRELFQRENGKPPTVLWLTKSSIVKTGGSIAELSRWDPDYKMLSLDGSDKPEVREFTASLAKKGTMGLLTNYEACKTTKSIRTTRWDIVIMDEVHKLKGGANANGPTAIWEAVRDVVRKSKFIIMLTGTPLVNKAEEMWSYMHIFAPEEFPSAKDFTRRFQGFRAAAGTFKMSIEADKLFKQALKGRLIRRTAVEVGLQLPQVIRQNVPLEHNPEQAAIYAEMKERFFIWLDTTQKALTTSCILDNLLRLRQINVLPVANFKIKDDEGNVIEELKLDVRDSSKLDEAVRIVLEHNQQAVGFCSFNEPLNELAFRLQVEGKSVAIISSATSEFMGSYEKDFQAGKLDVLLINSAMGEGLNLHKDPDKWEGGAGVGFTLDRWWNNARNDQCFKRIVRPGAPGPVFFYDLFVMNSVDDYIEMLCQEKDEQFNSLTEHSGARPREEVQELLRKLL